MMYYILDYFVCVCVCVCDSVLYMYGIYIPPTRKDTHVSPKGDIASKLAALCYGNILIKHVISDIHLY